MPFLVSVDLPPEPPDAEPSAADVRVVEQEDAPVAQLRQPGLEVVVHRRVAVRPVEVKQVDRAVGERRARRRRKSPGRRVENEPYRGSWWARQLLEHLRAVRAGVSSPSQVSTAWQRVGSSSPLTAWQNEQYESPFHVPSSTKSTGGATAIAKNANGMCSCQLSTSVRRRGSSKTIRWSSGAKVTGHPPAR